METIGQRIKRLRAPTGWSRAELGRRMAKAIDRGKPFSGELIRLYEKDINAPGVDARRALAKVFDRSEVYIQFGITTEVPTAQRVEQTTASYGLSDHALEIARAWDQLSAICQDHVRRQIELLRGADDRSGRRRAVRQDVQIRGGIIGSGAREKRRKPVRKRTP